MRHVHNVQRGVDPLVVRPRPSVSQPHKDGGGTAGAGGSSDHAGPQDHGEAISWTVIAVVHSSHCRQVGSVTIEKRWADSRAIFNLAGNPAVGCTPRAPETCGTW